MFAGALFAMSTPASGVAGFGDVGESAFYTNAVQWMVDNDITTGTSATCFSPGDPVTRGQAAAFMWRMEGEPSAPAHSFTDVTAGYQQTPVGWMAANNITTGTSPTTYAPDDQLTRGQLAALLHRLAESPSASGHPFNDITAGWQQTPVAWMVAEDITTGTSPSTFSPNDTVTRGQLATFFHRYKDSPAVTINPAHPISPACAQQVPGPSTTTTTTTTTIAGPSNTSTTTTISPLPYDSVHYFEIEYAFADYLCTGAFSFEYTYDCVRYYGGAAPSFFSPDLYCSGSRSSVTCYEYDPDDYFEVSYNGGTYVCESTFGYGRYNRCARYYGGAAPSFFTTDLYCTNSLNSVTCYEYDSYYYFEVSYNGGTYLCEDASYSYGRYDCVRYYGGAAPSFFSPDLYCSEISNNIDCSAIWYPDDLDNYEYITIGFSQYACLYSFVDREFSCVRYYGGQPPSYYGFPDYICAADFLLRPTNPCIQQ
jgi:hypothetical protein